MNQPIIVAHRGLHDEHPENSLKAFLAAWNAGVEWCECDVRGSLEHEPFVIHDATLERTTDGSGEVAKTPASVLHRLNLRRDDGSIAPTCVPRLATVIEAMPAEAKLLIEIKPGVDTEAVGRTLALCWPETCIIQSFDAAILRVADALRPAIRRMLLVDDAASADAVKNGPWEAVNGGHETITFETVAALRARKLAAGAWTVNADADIRHIRALGLDMIITDRPDRARDICRQIG